MKIGDTVLHSKFGKGQIVKILPDKVICLLANEQRAFTEEGAKAMHKAAIESTTLGTDFDRTEPKKAATVAATKRYFCKFCPREFEKEHSKSVHESQCKQNPNAKYHRNKRGVPQGNKNAAKQKDETIQAKTETIPHNVGGGTSNVAETVMVAWNKYLGDADETKNINQLSRDFLKKLVNGEIL